MTAQRTGTSARGRSWGVLLALLAGVALMPVPLTAQPDQAGALPPLGILFYTPSTRQALDEARRSGRSVKTGVGERQAVQTTLRIDGMVVPRNGRRTAWVNGRLVRSGEEVSRGLRVTVEDADPGLVRLKTPDQGEVKVKPGESIQALLDEPLQPPAAMRAPGPVGAPGRSGDPDSLEARLDQIPADVSLRDLISALLKPKDSDAASGEEPTRDDDDGNRGDR